MNIFEKIKKFGVVNYAFAILFFGTSNMYGQHNISVDVTKKLNDVSGNPVGINVNYLMDGGFTQPATSTADALKNMGVKFLRFPGGEKADNYLWSVSPWDKPNAKFSRTGTCEWPSGDSRFAEGDNQTAKDITLDFDEFMTMCKTIGGEPLIVVAYDAMYKASSCSGKVPTREELLKNAEEWVRYANKVKNYGIKYWMIGNESYMSCEYNGCASASQYRDDVIEFSQRMKAVDPTIKIIANGDGSSWWKTVLPKAAYSIDYIGVSNYPVWSYSGGYEYYKNNAPYFLNVVKNTKNFINKFAPKSERSRIKIITTEFNSMDYSGKWPDANDAGHALAAFEILGEHLKEPDVEAALFGNTRWTDNTTVPNHIYDALDKNGNLNANGKAISILANNLLNEMVYTTATKQVRSFATFNASTNQLNVFLVNKQTSNQTANLSFSGYNVSANGAKWVYQSAGPADLNPTWIQAGNESFSGSALSLALPPVSITMIKFTPGEVVQGGGSSGGTDTTSITDGGSGTTGGGTTGDFGSGSTSGGGTVTVTPIAGGTVHNISVNASSILTDVSQKPMGINMDYLMDGSYLSPSTSTTTALKNLGVKFLRYPGGEKADNYLWSVSPWDKSDPHFARTGYCEWPTADGRFGNTDYSTAKSVVLDFDEFMSVSRTIGGEPLIVVPYDAMYKSSSCGGKAPTRDELLKNAEEWVRYANKVKGYNVKYWMIGNESYMSCNYNGCATATQYRDDVIDFSKRMKAVDPTIKIVANGDGESWFQTVLPTAAYHIDYIGISNYPAYNFSGGYDYYKNNTPDFVGGVRNIENYINKYAPSSERSRLKVITTEFNSMDWSGKWTDANDAGHALAAFEILGQHLIHPKVEAAIFWNTRWVDNATKPQHIYDALDKNGNFNANGLALSIWGNNLLDKMITTSSTTQVRSFATYRQISNEINLFLINKETSDVTANVSLSNYLADAAGEWWIMYGNGQTDQFPKWVNNGTLQANGNTLAVNLPSASVTMVKLKPQTTAQSGSPIISENKTEGVTEALEIYPNPANNMVTLNILQATEAPIVIKVLSLDGKEIYSSQFSGDLTKIDLDVKEWPQGMYIIQMFSGNKSYAQKLLVE